MEYNIYPQVEVKKDGIIIDISSPWYTSKVASIEQSFFTKEIFDHPIIHVLPRKNSLNGLYKFDCEDSGSMDGFSNIYDIDRVKSESYIEEVNGYDPLAVYTSIQHQRLKSSTEPNVDVSFFENLKNLLLNSENLFFQKTFELLKQNYYITFNSKRCLSPAIDVLEETKKFVSGYIQEEYGHHQLILMSMKELMPDLDVSELTFSHEAKEVMETLKLVSSKSMVALSCALSYFEAGSFHSEDPFALLLRNSSRPDAAIGLEKHFKINKDGNHGLVGFELAKKLKKCISEKELEFTVQQMSRLEHFSVLMVDNIMNSGGKIN